MFVFLLPLDYFAQSKNYTFLETLGHLASFEMCHLASFDIWDTFCPILYNLQTRKNDIIKQFFFDCCRSRLCGTFIFHTLIGAYKNCRLTKFYHDHTIFVCFTDLNRFAGFSLQNLLL